MHTIKEITHQPSLWRQINSDIYEERYAIQSFLDHAINKSDSIILTGAGTSAFIGLACQSSFRKKFQKISEPVSTTDIVSHPEDFFISKSNLLMISFARSGNSPESYAAIELANKYCENVSHLIITCNENGALAKNCSGRQDTYVYILPPMANDRSLAMTSSFTGMMLSAILMARVDELEDLNKHLNILCKYGAQAIGQSQLLMDITKQQFNRALFLGSGPLYGVAKEAQLKMQELTDGKVICKHDSFLGLRHGPKVVIDNKTLVTYHLSNNQHAKKYDMDLISSLRNETEPLGILAIGEDISGDYDWKINYEVGSCGPLDEDLYGVASIVPAQILAYHKSVYFGLNPDNPSPNGVISRVVQGVSIYHP